MPVQTKTFRIFVSSTFSDMREERRILQRDVFPKLEKYCEQNGAQFQAIDLRWGVNEESQLDQKTMDICLNEIRRCQKMSPKPNFIMLLGDRYGWKPLPARIDAGEFEKMVDLTPGPSPTGEGSKSLLSKWYCRDDNAIPPEYVLQQRGEYAAWEPIERTLLETLRAAAEKAGLTESQKIKYFASATHQEIMVGALNPPQEVPDAREHVFAYLRTVEGLPEDETAGQYVDLVDGKADPYSKKQLENLRKELTDSLGDEHCVKYPAAWKNGAVALADAQAFGEMVYNHLHTIIEAQIKEFVSPGEVEHERLLQKEFRERLVEHFSGREEVLKEIDKYLTSPPAPLRIGEGRKIFALVGASGSGKSSVMAKAITEAKQRKEFHVYRFLGTTSRTSDVMGLLQSLCAEITGYFGTTMEELFCKGVKDDARAERLKALSTENGMRELFNTSLTLATPDKPIMLFLDALDQLSGAEEPGSLFWLPRELPANVACVVSCLPTLENQLSYAEVNHLDQMPVKEAGVILDAWLGSRDCKRTLLKEQRDAIFSAFGKTGLPIYLRLAFEAARKWHSYDPAPALPDDVGGMLGQFFSELERVHTKITVARAIGYMLSGRYSGLTEKEILDMLAFDDEHWQAFLARTHKDHREEVKEAKTLPIVVWSRLFLDLEPYLTERNMFGVRIVTFFHRQFVEHARAYYCGKTTEHANAPKIYGTPPSSQLLHKNLARYFAGLPLFVDGDKREMPNVHKCIEQPWQETKAEMWENVTETLCDIFFVEAKVKAGLVDGLQGDYEGALKGMAEKEGEERKSVDDFYYLFMRQKHVLAGHPGLIFQQLYNELQWKNGRLKERAEKTREAFIKAGGRFLHQYREPKIDTSHLIATLSGHSDGVESCAYSPDGARIVSGSRDKTLKIWDAKTGKEITTITGHSDEVSSCAYSPDGAWIVSGSDDNTLKIWDAKMGKEITTITGHSKRVNSCAYSPDGARIVSGGGGGDKTLKIWDAKTGQEITALTGGGDGWGVYSCAFSPDGARIVSGSGGFGSANHTLKIWDAKTGQEITTLTGHRGEVNSCAYSPDGARIVSGSEDKTLKIWDAKTGQEITTLSGHIDRVTSCVYSPDGARIVSGGGFGDKTLKIWDAKTGQEITTLSGHSNSVTSCAYSPDGAWIVSGSDDNTLKIWDAKMGREITTLTGHSDGVLSCAYSPDGAQIVSASWDNTLKIWYAKTGQEITTLTGHIDRVTSCVYSPDGARIVSGSDDWTLKIWDAKTGQEIMTLIGHNTGHTSGVTSCAYSPDGARIVSASRDKTLKIWDAKTGQVITTLTGHTSGEISCAYSPDGARIVSGSYDNTLKIWDAKTGQEITTLNGHSSWVESCAYSPDGARIVSASWDKTLKIWDAKTGREIMTLTGHSDRVNSCAYSSDGARIVSGSWDKTLKIWDAKTGREQVTFICDAVVDAAAICRSGSKMAAGDRSSNIYFLKLDSFEFGIPFITGARLLLFGESGSSGAYSPDIATVCPFCGIQFSIAASPRAKGLRGLIQSFRGNKLPSGPTLLDTILSINRDCHIGPDDSPCVKLPKEAWDDPHLLSECPKCKKPLRFNPFVVDNRQ